MFVINNPTYLVYALSDPFTNQVRYVGKSTSGMLRPKSHIKPCQLDKEFTHKANWIRSLKSKNTCYDIFILSVLPNKDHDKLFRLEQYWISHFKPTGLLTNHQDGGPGSPGRKLSEESRKKMSESAKRRPLPQTLIDNQKPKLFKKPKPKHPCRAIPGAREAARKKLLKPVISRDADTGEITEFEGIRFAATSIGGKCNKTGIRFAIKSQKPYYGRIWNWACQHS